jgi:hypothetical protein
MTVAKAAWSSSANAVLIRSGSAFGILSRWAFAEECCGPLDRGGRTLGICWVRGPRDLSRFSFNFSLTFSPERIPCRLQAGFILAEFLLRVNDVLQQAAELGADVVACSYLAQGDAE